MSQEIEDLKRELQSQSNSTIGLALVELDSGNFTKALNLAEEAIKANNISSGWAVKSIAQSHLFDYDEQFHLLNSSLQSLSEYLRSNQTTSGISTTEFYVKLMVLNRTVILVSKKIDEVNDLRKRALAENQKAALASLTAAFSAYSGADSKSTTGKVIGYGGAVAALHVRDNFNSNADLLRDASKGVFGVAIANMLSTIDIALDLKSRINSMSSEQSEKIQQTLQSWTIALASLYEGVVENIYLLCKQLNAMNPASKEYSESALSILNSHEARQLIAFSRAIKMDTSIEVYSSIEQLMTEISEMPIEEISKARKSQIYEAVGISIGSFVLGLILEKGLPDLNTTWIVAIGIPAGFIWYALYAYNPKGKLGELKKKLKALEPLLLEFKNKSKEKIQLILNN